MRKKGNQLGAAPVALLGEGFWKSHFAGDPEIIGKSLTIDGKTYTVIGVIPAFRIFRTNGDSFFDDIYVPIGQWDEKLFRDRDYGSGMEGIGRLRSSTTVQQARADMDEVARNLGAAYPGVDKGVGITVEFTRGRYRR